MQNYRFMHPPVQPAPPVYPVSHAQPAPNVYPMPHTVRPNAPPYSVPSYVQISNRGINIYPPPTPASNQRPSSSSSSRSNLSNTHQVSSNEQNQQNFRFSNAGGNRSRRSDPTVHGTPPSEPRILPTAEQNRQNSLPLVVNASILAAVQNNTRRVQASASNVSQNISNNSSDRNLNRRVSNPRHRSRSRSPLSRDEPPEKRVCSRAMTNYEMRNIQRIYKKDLSENELECGICYEGYDGRKVIRRLKCKHSFHQVCIFGWLKKDSTCPFCRYNLIEDDENDNDKNNSSGSSRYGQPLSRRN